MSLPNWKLRELWRESGYVDVDIVSSVDWLRKQEYDTWHSIALNWNWDSGTESMNWILSQPDCDLGTACAVFFLIAPDHLEYSATEAKECYLLTDFWAMCDKLCKRLNADDFSNRALFPYDTYRYYGKALDDEHIKKNQLDYQEQKAYFLRVEQETLSKGGVPAWSVPKTVFDYEGTRHYRSDYCSEDCGVYLNFEAWLTNSGPNTEQQLKPS